MATAAATRTETGVIKLLILEDNPADAKLMLRELNRAGFTIHADVARHAEEFKRFASAHDYQLVLADFYGLDWTGLDACRWLRGSGYNVPLILVTGSLGDEQAVECLKEGASDYVLKDKIERLPLAARHALNEDRLRKSRDRAESELRESEKQYRLLFNSNPQPMLVCDLESLDILAVNDSAVRHYGYSREEFLSFTVKDIRKPEDLSKPHNLKPEATGVWEHRKKDGSIIYVQITEGKLSFGDHSANLICIEDITERRVLEQQFQQAQKMEAVGRLAGGVAHDFNNLLMIISSSAQLLQDRMDSVETIDKYANQIRSAADKAAGLTRQLLAFSRQQILQPCILDLNVIVADLLKMLPRLLGEDIEVVVSFESQLGKVNADRGQLEQVIMNLAINARDAMPSGGTLSIETANVAIDEAYAQSHFVKVQPGEYVVLAITDNGIGMTPEVQAKIFEPFYTTKAVGKGTGLGLATVYGIVKQSGGLIWVYSEAGQGTTFKVYLPRAAGKAAQAPRAVETPPLVGKETVLLVEDEQALRQVAADYLMAQGYVVLQAESGPSAVSLCDNHGGTIDVLITDIVMPGYGGPQLAQALLSRRPSLHVIFVSGYTDGALTEDILKQGSVFLQKPFDLKMLATKIRSFFDK